MKAQTFTQSLRPDKFFCAAQQQRLGELMVSWRQARDSETVFPADKQIELDALIEAELYAAGYRAAQMADEAGR